MCLARSPDGSMHMGSQEVVLGQLGSLSSQLFAKELMLHMAWDVMLGCSGLSTWQIVLGGVFLCAYSVVQWRGEKEGKRD